MEKALWFGTPAPIAYLRMIQMCQVLSPDIYLTLWILRCMLLTCARTHTFHTLPDTWEVQHWLPGRSVLPAGDCAKRPTCQLRSQFIGELAATLLMAFLHPPEQSRCQTGEGPLEALYLRVSDFRQLTLQVFSKVLHCLCGCEETLYSSRVCEIT